MQELGEKSNTHTQSLSLSPSQTHTPHQRMYTYVLRVGEEFNGKMGKKGKKKYEKDFYVNDM